MGDLSVRGIARKYAGKTGAFSMKNDVLKGATGGTRAKLEALARKDYSFGVSECIYGWTASFEQTWTHVRVRIRLNPDAGISQATMNTLMAAWQAGIPATWDNRWSCARPGELPCRLRFEVLWVSSNQHHTVRVRPGPERSNMTCWDTQDTGAVASHEYGHMLGNVDEYADGNCPSRNPVNTGTVMDNNSAVVPARLVQRFADNIGSNLVAP